MPFYTFNVVAIFWGVTPTYVILPYAMIMMQPVPLKRLSDFSMSDFSMSESSHEKHTVIIINPWCACAAWVTVLVLCVRVCVCLFFLFCLLMLLGVQQEVSAATAWKMQ